jgi:hypothetical protein
MRVKPLIGATLTTLVLVGCGGSEPKPDSYWMKHQAEADTQIEKCRAKRTDLAQAARTKPPEALSAFERECLYLYLSGDYQRDKRRAEGPQSILD